MGSLVTSIFTVMLGWVRSVAAWTRELLNGERGSGSQWLGEHWIIIFIALCVIGALIDLAVYLARWQPFRVWRDMLGRIGNRGNKAAKSEWEPPVTETGSDEYYNVQNAPAAEEYDRMEIHVYTGDHAEPAVQQTVGGQRRRRAARYQDQTDDGPVL
ncbi:MAG: hypothetical protein MJ142_04045 [Clostridia bacterium]|nr:hypothetical protein [Clostridia bacterium]